MTTRALGVLCGGLLAAACSLDGTGTANRISGTGGASASGGLGGQAGALLGGSGGVGAIGGSGGVTGGTGGTGGTGATGGAAGGGGTAGVGGAAGAGGSGGGGPVFDPPWWNATWKSRWNVNVKSNAGALPQGFQVGLPVKAASIDAAAAPYDAWRMVRWDGVNTSELHRVVEDAGSEQWIWFSTQAGIAQGATDSSYWLYASAPTAGAPADGSDIFEFHSSFATENATLWGKTGAVSYGGGAVVLDGNASIRSQTQTWGPGYAVDFGMTVMTPLASSNQWFCGGFQRQYDFTDLAPWMLWISRSPSNIRTEVNDGGAVDWFGSNVPVNQGVAHIYSIARFAKKAVYRYDHADKANHSWGSDYTTPLQIRFTAYNGSKIRVTFARIRQAADPPPTATLGKNEQYP